MKQAGINKKPASQSKQAILKEYSAQRLGGIPGRRCRWQMKAARNYRSRSFCENESEAQKLKAARRR